MPAIEFLQSSPVALTTVAVLLGLMVGSFLNVVIHRMPIMLGREWRSQALDVLEEWSQREDAPESLRKPAESLVEVRKLAAAAPRYNIIVPRSACPKCGHAISAIENIPVVSWFWLRGRCKGCSTRIRARYPLIEALTGIISGYVAWHFGFTWAAFGGLLFCWILIAATFIDFDTQLLPDDLTLPLLWIGLLFNMGGVFTSLSSAVVGAVAGYLALWSVYWAFKLATGKEGMGYGDFKLLAAIGAWLGWKMLPAVILLSSAVGATVGIALIVLARHGRHVPIPFGPYLAAAGVLALFWGDAINRAILQGF
jgi:leader peptidase (prepilin peptidase) / N-methyltransferase